MNVDYILIGQGISGSFLANELHEAGQSFIVFDDNGASASRIASGIINPVTGRRIVKTWIIDEIMPYAWHAYTKLGNRLGIDVITQIKNIDFFPTPQMRLAFLERIQEDASYLSLPEDENDWHHLLNYNFGYGIIDTCYLVNLQQLLPAFRKFLLDKNLLREERFHYDELKVSDNGVTYQDIIARKIIFCDGIEGQDSRWFKNLPFAPNKGEVLIVAIDGLPATNILKKGINIVPWKENLFWVGSSHEWQFETDQPTETFRTKTTAQLTSFLKLPFTVMEHWAAVRPATLERRPFIGLHPQYPAVGIFNGMGTKGCSLAPYFANQLTRHLVSGKDLLPDVNVERFKKVMSRG